MNKKRLTCFLWNSLLLWFLVGNLLSCRAGGIRKMPETLWRPDHILRSGYIFLNHTEFVLLDPQMSHVSPCQTQQLSMHILKDFFFVWSTLHYNFSTFRNYGASTEQSLPFQKLGPSLACVLFASFVCLSFNRNAILSKLKRNDLPNFGYHKRNDLPNFAYHIPAPTVCPQHFLKIQVFLHLIFKKYCWRLQQFVKRFSPSSPPSLTTHLSYNAQGKILGLFWHFIKIRVIQHVNHIPFQLSEFTASTPSHTLYQKDFRGGQTGFRTNIMRTKEKWPGERWKEINPFRIRKKAHGNLYRKKIELIFHQFMKGRLLHVTNQSKYLFGISLIVIPLTFSERWPAIHAMPLENTKWMFWKTSKWRKN